MKPHRQYVKEQIRKDPKLKKDLQKAKRYAMMLAYRPVRKRFTLVFWGDKKMLVGRLREIPWVISQGPTLLKLEKNIREVYHLMMKDNKTRRKVRMKHIVITEGSRWKFIAPRENKN